MKFFNFSADHCKNCYKCVRNCPVKAIKFRNDEAEIDEEKCIACGRCYVVCPKRARVVGNYIQELKDAFAQGKKVVACVDSSYVGIFHNPGQFVTGLKMLGFSSVQEIAVGCEAVVKKYIDYVKNNSDLKYIITSSCPSAYLFIRKYHPQLTKYLIPVVTPMLALGKAIKKEDKNCFTVYIGPCLSKKYEIYPPRIDADIDALINFEEIIRLFKQNFIDLDVLVETEPDRTPKECGENYSIAGDIWKPLRQAIEENNYDFLFITGLDHVKSLFQSMEENTLERAYIGISACDESCINGPFIPKNRRDVFTNKQKLRSFAKKGWSTVRDDIDWSNIDLSRTHKPICNERIQASPEKIKEILEKMGKKTKMDELDCGACGYNTCRQKAQAVFEGMAEIEMCMPYMRSKAEKMTDVYFLNSVNTLLLLDENLNVIQLNPVAEKMLGIKNDEIAGKPIPQLLEEKEFMDTIHLKKNLVNAKVHLPKFDLVVLQNVVYIKNENMILITMQDITQEEKRKKELDELKTNTVNTAQSVIEKQMRVAQNIASLLGETTAETKVALNKLKDIVMKEGD